MTIELSHDGYEKIEAQIQAIENLAYDGVFSNGGAPGICQKITLEAKNLRQIVREVTILVPDAVKAPAGGGSAA